MKKAVLTSFLLFFCGVLTSQAVVIGWASETAPAGTTSAILVYVSDGSTPVYGGGELTTGTQIGDTVTSGAIFGNYILPQNTEDTTTRNSGSYYVIVFNELQQYVVSNNTLAWDNGPSISTGELDPITSNFMATFNEDPTWTPVPEPGTAMLLMVGTAAVLWRRKRV